MHFTDIDPNLVFGNIGRDSLFWIDRRHAGVEIDGAAEIDSFSRIGDKELPLLPQNIQWTATCTPGVRMRFCTDSDYIALKAVIRYTDDLSHMPRSGSGGFDLYAGETGQIPQFRKVFMPEAGRPEVSGEIAFQDRRRREILIHFPLYNGVAEIAIGLPPDALLLAPEPFLYRYPVVFYGSSITQGGCASRPGNAYPAIVCRELRADMVNLGFSGNAKGEPEMARCIASMPMTAFVMDYDYNADSAEDLRRTHEPFFRIVRERHPDLPILLISKPNVDFDREESDRRRAVILDTYRRAKNRGDRRVYFIDGADLFGENDRDGCTVDGCHPNDLGFWRMAQTVLPVLRQALEEAGL